MTSSHTSRHPYSIDRRKQTGKVVFSDEFKRAIWQTWNQIAYDLCDISSNSVAIEACLDADRLEFNGDSPEANAELKRLCAEHGWSKVCNAANRQFKFV